jgi:selenide,water dikinase
MRSFDVSACTDVTGFGLAGHAYEMSGKGRVSLRFEFGRLPILPEARELAAMGIIPGGTYSNRSYLESRTLWEVGTADDILFYDAQTSGGLLIAVAEGGAQILRDRLRNEGYESAEIVGEVLPAGERALIVG